MENRRILLKGSQCPPKNPSRISQAIMGRRLVSSPCSRQELANTLEALLVVFV
jgi:hypothetical protein